MVSCSDTRIKIADFGLSRVTSNPLIGLLSYLIHLTLQVVGAELVLQHHPIPPSADSEVTDAYFDGSREGEGQAEGDRTGEGGSKDAETGEVSDDGFGMPAASALLSIPAPPTKLQRTGVPLPPVPGPATLGTISSNSSTSSLSLTISTEGTSEKDKLKGSLAKVPLQRTLTKHVVRISDGRRRW